VRRRGEERESCIDTTETKVVFGVAVMRGEERRGGNLNAI
jgi:hypothetical protein